VLPDAMQQLQRDVWRNSGLQVWQADGELRRGRGGAVAAVRARREDRGIEDAEGCVAGVPDEVRCTCPDSRVRMQASPDSAARSTAAGED